MLETLLLYATMAMPWVLIVLGILMVLIIVARIVTKYGNARMT